MQKAKNNLQISISIFQIKILKWVDRLNSTVRNWRYCVFHITDFDIVVPSSFHSHWRIWDVRSNTKLLMTSCCFGSQQKHLIYFMDYIKSSLAHGPNHCDSTAISKQDIDDKTVSPLYKHF